MCSSSMRRWVVGLLLAAAVAAAVIGYLMSKKPEGRADKGTLVQAAESVTAAGAKWQGFAGAGGGCL